MSRRRPHNFHDPLKASIHCVEFPLPSQVALAYAQICILGLRHLKYKARVISRIFLRKFEIVANEAPFWGCLNSKYFLLLVYPDILSRLTRGPEL